MTCTNSEPYWLVKTGDYVLIYNITYSMNPYFTDYDLYEYGIECSLYNTKDELLSSEHVSHISPDINFVNEILHRLVGNQVFPVHLKDIVCDLLEEVNTVTVPSFQEAIA